MEKSVYIGLFLIAFALVAFVLIVGVRQVLLEPPICGDGVCEQGETFYSCSEDCVTKCSDEIDNDEDGYIDLIDIGCSDSGDNSESTADGCRANFTSVDGNLIFNPTLECGLFDGWVKYADDSTHLLSWMDDPLKEGHGRVFKTEFTGEGEVNEFGWIQAIGDIKPDTLYEFSVSFAGGGGESVPGNDSKSIGAAIVIYENSEENGSNEVNDTNSILWFSNEEIGWHTKTLRFETPINAATAMLRTYNYQKGRGYFDNFVLKKIGNGCSGESCGKDNQTYLSPEKEITKGLKGLSPGADSGNGAAGGNSLLTIIVIIALILSGIIILIVVIMWRRKNKLMVQKADELIEESMGGEGWGALR